MTKNAPTDRKEAAPAQSETPLNCDRDPVRWAREFRAVLKMQGTKLLDDEGWLIGWFANAMMCGEDTYRWRQEAALRAKQSGEARAELICPRCGDEWRGQGCVSDCPLWQEIERRTAAATLQPATTTKEG